MWGLLTFLALAVAASTLVAGHYALVPLVLRSRLSRDERRLLDFGCGAGKNARLLARLMPRLRIAGVDVDAALWTSDASGGRRRVSPRASHRAVVYDGRLLPFRDAAFDSSIAAYVLHHVHAPDLAALLSELRRVTRGRLYVFEDCIETRYERAAFAHHAGPNALARSGVAWRDVFAAAGYRVVETRPIHRWCWPVVNGCASYLVPRMLFVLEG
jgi:SAM-dependent methyltransferase